MEPTAPGTAPVYSVPARRLFSEDFWLGALWFATLVQAVVVATHAPAGRSDHGFEFALANVLVVIGLFSHCALSLRRGHLEMPWLGFLFPLAFVLFHFGTFGLDHRWYAPEFFGYAWQVASLGLLSWLCGYDLTRGRRRIRRRPVFTIGGRAISPLQAGTVLLVAKMGFVLSVALQASLPLSYGAVAFFTRVYGKEALTPTGDNWQAYLYALGGITMAPSLVTLAVASVGASGRLFPTRRWAIAVGLYLATFLLEGDRGELTAAVLPLVFVRHYWVRRIPWRYGVILVAVGLTMFGTLKLYRGKKDVVAAVTQTFQVSTYEMLMHEMGNTLDTVVRSMALVPTRENYFAGKTYLWALARALPNVSLQPRDWGFVSSVWIVEKTAPDVAARFGGFGYSVVAEAYINFGGVGAGAFLCVIGLLTGTLERRLAGPRVSIWAIVLVLLFEMALLMHVRNTAVIFVRGFIWTAAIVLMLRATSSVLFVSRPRRPLKHSVMGSGREIAAGNPPLVEGATT
ncbi:MAG: O-antigen polysaccharide polymerase Wzy [bacterium]|nr:O-antigen polysaccharide polymerase Wzy [bacterium]